MAKDFDSDDEPADGGVKLPERQLLLDTLASLSKHGSTLQQVRGHISADLKLAEEGGVHRQVIKLVDRLKRMDENKRLDWFAHFDSYAEQLDLRVQQQPDMFEAAAE